jgi:UPF0271 protein
MDRRTIDLNADLGEGFPNDEALLDRVTSASIACGAHAGDPEIIVNTLRAAQRRGVIVGAHPGYADRAGFGRREQSLSSAEVERLIDEQVESLRMYAAGLGLRLGFVKPHGALYNQAAAERSLAVAIIAGIRAFHPSMRLVGLAGSAMEHAARALGHPFTPEAFADRRYRRDGSLVPRTDPSAVLTKPDEVAAQVRRLVSDGEVVADDGSSVNIAFESLCLHSDTPGAPALAARVRQELQQLGVTVAAPRLLAFDTLPP